MNARPAHLRLSVVVLSLFVASLAHGNRWGYSDGTWLVSDGANWLDGVWADGQTAQFNAWSSHNRNGNVAPGAAGVNEVVISGSVAPSAITFWANNGGATWNFSGGDITGPTGMTIDDGDVNSNNHVWVYWARDFSFTGAVNINNWGTRFGFLPASSTTISKTFNLAGANTLALLSNANADWSGSTVNVGRNLLLATNDAVWTGMNLRLQDNYAIDFVHLPFNAAANTVNFNGTVSGATRTVSLTSGGSGASGRKLEDFTGTLSGGLAWNVSNVNQANGMTIRLAPNDYSTAFQSLAANGGAYNLNSGRLQPRDSANTTNLTTFDLYFPLNVNNSKLEVSSGNPTPANGGQLGTVTQVNVKSGGFLGGIGTLYDTAITVDAGGILGGNLTVRNSSRTIAVNAGGRVAPGNSLGTVRLAADTVFAAGGVLELEVDGSTGDLLVIEGSATVVDLTAGTLRIVGSHSDSPILTLLDGATLVGTPESFFGVLDYNGNTSYATPFALRGIAGNYQLEWRGDSLYIIQSIPEPASLALLGLLAVSLSMRAGRTALRRGKRG